MATMPELNQPNMVNENTAESQSANANATAAQDTPAPATESTTPLPIESTAPPTEQQTSVVPATNTADLTEIQVDGPAKEGLFVKQSDELIAELEIIRADHSKDEDFLTARATHLPNASGIMENEDWGGDSPRALLEIVIKGGPLKGKLQAGGRIWVGVKPV